MKNTIQSITRAFQILRVVHNQPQASGVSVGAIAEQTGLHISTISRHLTIFVLTPIILISKES